MGDEMTELSDIQARFNAALAIVKRAETSSGNLVETNKSTADAPTEQQLLTAAEGDERYDNSYAEVTKVDLEKMNDCLKKEQDTINTLKKELAEKDTILKSQRATMVQQIETLDKARCSSEESLNKVQQHVNDLEQLNTELRAANEQNLGQPDLINKSLELELKQIKVQRNADLETVNAILARLTPLVEGAVDG
jgi:septal ring factor EnvC (AmiA/AmiB activator)